MIDSWIYPEAVIVGFAVTAGVFFLFLFWADMEMHSDLELEKRLLTRLYHVDVTYAVCLMLYFFDLDSG